jgi:hypothetical protein
MISAKNLRERFEGIATKSNHFFAAEKDGVAAVGAVDPFSPLAIQVSTDCDCPMLWLMFQEDSFWEYGLSNGGHSVDLFSTLPNAWDEPHGPEWKRNPRLLAELWGIPKERIEKYLTQWKKQWCKWPYDTSPKAYPTDKFTYGNIGQAYDFVAALGAVCPQTGVNYPAPVDGFKYSQFSLELPSRYPNFV